MSRLFHNNRDNQKNRAYKWERALLMHDPIIDDSELRRIFKELCGFFHIDDAQLCLSETQLRMATKGEFRKSSRASFEIYSYRYGFVVWLIPKHRNISILLHEFAHVLVSKFIEQENYYKKAKMEKNRDVLIAPHGREWLTAYMILLNKVLKIDKNVLINSARNFKLDFDHKRIERLAND